MECGAKSIADGLENIASVGCDGLSHEDIVPGKRDLHRPGMRFPDFGAALDIGEQQRYRAMRSVDAISLSISARSASRGGHDSKTLGLGLMKAVQWFKDKLLN